MFNYEQSKDFEKELLHRISVWGYQFGEISPAQEFVQSHMEKFTEKVTLEYLYDAFAMNIKDSNVVENILYIISHINFIHVLPYINHIFSKIYHSYSNDSTILDLVVRCCEQWNTAFVISEIDHIIKHSKNKNLIEYASGVKIDILSSDQTEMNKLLFFTAIKKYFPTQTEFEVINYINNKDNLVNVFEMIASFLEIYKICYDINDNTYRIIHYKNKHEIIEYKRANTIFDAIFNSDSLIYFFVRSHCCYR